MEDSANKTEQPTKVEVHAPPQESTKTSFLERTGVYGLELGVAMVTMFIVAVVLSVGSFSLAQYLYGTVNTSLGESALWSAASAIVWLPVVYIFYMRSRAYMARNPEINNNQTQRAFVLIYQVITLLAVIGFAFAAVYSLLNAFVQASDMGRTLLTVSMPSAVSAALFGGAFVAFFRRPVVSRKTFGRGLLVVSLLITIPVIVFSMIMLRSANLDERKANDLETLDLALTQYFNNENELPRDLSTALSGSDVELEGPVSDYDYKRVSANEFEICATFATDTSWPNGNANRYYNDYDSHNKGKQCYSEEVTPSSFFRDDFRIGPDAY